MFVFPFVSFSGKDLARAAQAGMQMDTVDRDRGASAKCSTTGIRKGKGKSGSMGKMGMVDTDVREEKNLGTDSMERHANG